MLAGATRVLASDRLTTIVFTLATEDGETLAARLATERWYVTRHTPMSRRPRAPSGPVASTAGDRRHQVTSRTMPPRLRYAILVTLSVRHASGWPRCRSSASTSGGSFAGLTDDHFFYLIRGWQILLGDLPVRDFADQGAPLYYYVAAAVQVVFGRGTLSEFTYSVTVLSARAATLTYWLGLRASGSLLAGWERRFSSSSSRGCTIIPSLRSMRWPCRCCGGSSIVRRPPRFWLAVITASAFLFRHDHGVFVAVAFAALLLVHGELS